LGKDINTLPPGFKKPYNWFSKGRGSRKCSSGPLRVFQVGLHGALAKGCARGQCFGVHLYARHLAAFGVQDACDGAGACAQFKHALTGLDHARQDRGGTATVGVNFVGVAMFYH
jgi:hypothetical protein